MAQVRKKFYFNKLTNLIIRRLKLVVYDHNKFKDKIQNSSEVFNIPPLSPNCQMSTSQGEDCLGQTRWILTWERDAQREGLIKF